MMHGEVDQGAFDRATLAFYDTEAPIYAASGKGGVSRWLEGFLAELPVGARVLELGCGGGRDAEAMLRRGFDVHPTDGSAAIAAKAEGRLGRPVTIMRFDELAEVQAYDGVWANASLLHVPRVALGDVVARVFRALKPGGLHFASFKAGTCEGRDSFGRYFNYLDREALIGIYEASGRWDELSIIKYIGNGYQAGEVAWIALTARRLPCD